jgi:hypothetical protein
MKKTGLVSEEVGLVSDHHDGLCCRLCLEHMMRTISDLSRRRLKQASSSLSLRLAISPTAPTTTVISIIHWLAPCTTSLLCRYIQSIDRLPSTHTRTRANALRTRARLSHDDTVKPLLEPSNSVFRSNLVLSSNLGSHPLSSSDSHTRSTHDDVKVHTENTDSWVVFDTEVDVLLDTETEVAGGGEVSRLLVRVDVVDEQSGVK